MKLKTTYGEMESGVGRNHTNDKLMLLTNALINQDEARRKGKLAMYDKKEIIWMSGFYEKKQKKTNHRNNKQTPSGPRTTNEHPRPRKDSLHE